MKIEVKTISHSNIFHMPADHWDHVQNPIIEQLKKDYMYGKFRERFCKTCGDPMKFSVQREFNKVRAVFHCLRCYGDIDEGRPKVRWGYGI